jgi:1,4-dihydroxy-2-naphthoate octaprenyltransferase
MLHPSTLQLLRLPFSLFLAPVFLFALSESETVNWPAAILVAAILHLLVYPASNGYNSYMDRDETPIGGLSSPMQPTLQLFRITVAMDLLAIILGFFISRWFAAGIILYIMASRAYSFRGIRLKKYPLIAYLTVILFQGAVTFALVRHGCTVNMPLAQPALPLIAASLLIGGFYPLTQVYQHEADRLDGVRSISMRLGYRGTFLFCASVHIFAFACIGMHYMHGNRTTDLVVFAVAMSPALLYFLTWAKAVWADTSAADFSHAMRMNKVGAACSSTAFIVMIIMKQFE